MADQVQQWIDNAKKAGYSDDELKEYFQKGGAGPKTMAKYFTAPPQQAQGSIWDQFKPEGAKYWQSLKGGTHPDEDLTSFMDSGPMQNLQAIQHLTQGSYAAGGADLLEGMAKTVAPAAVPAMVANPLATLLGLTGAGAGGAAGNVGARMAGASDDQARLAGDVAAIPAGAIAGKTGSVASDIWNALRNPANKARLISKLPGGSAWNEIMDILHQQESQKAPVAPPPLGKYHGGQEQPSMAAPPVTFPPQQTGPQAPPVTFKPPLEGPTEVAPHPAPPVRFKKPAAEVRPNYPAPPVTFKPPAEADNTDIAEALGLSPPKQPDDIYHQQANAKIDPMDAVVKDRNIAGYLKREGYTKEKYDSLTLAQKKDLIKQVPFHNKQPYRWSDDLEARAPQTIRALLPDK